MTPDAPANLAGGWARLLVDSLAEAGIGHVVVSPGSRSTPLVLALAGHPRLDVSVVLDEREAAFFALGTAKATGLPALAVCTSGSAGAHYLPAAIEAAQARVPLLLLTADRPPRLQQRDAPQTVEQAGMFGRFARASFELGLPSDSPAALRALRQAAGLAVARACDPEPGPVHLNAPFDKPLEPAPPNGADAAFEAALAAARAATLPRVIAPRALARDQAVESLAAAVGRARRGVILAGPLPAWDASVRPAAERLAAALGWPLLAEATSQLRFAPFAPGGATLRVGPFDLAWQAAAWRTRLAPDFVLQLGGVPAGRGVEQLLAGSAPPPRAVITRHGVADPFATAALVVHAEPGPLLDALAERAGAPRAEPGWADAWRAFEAEASAALAALLPDDDAPLTEAAALRVALGALPDGGALGLANSLPVRAIDLFAAADRRDLAVFAQRGANGIDGLLAGAAGFAAAARRPLLLLVGDLAFQHGLGGLAVARACPQPLAIVVLANGGGRLFELLPLAEAAVPRAVFERYFLAPQALAAGDAARAFDVPSVTASTARALGDAVAGALARPGASVIEARLAPPDAAATWRALVARLAAGAP